MNGVESKVSPEVVSQAVSSLDKYILNHYGRPTRRTLRERQIPVAQLRTSEFLIIDKD